MFLTYFIKIRHCSFPVLLDSLNYLLKRFEKFYNLLRNPYPGKIYNVPGGEDVYAGVVIDYSGIHVTPENFLAVLSGNKSAVKGGSGRVIESTYYDRIFAYFTDHGGVGLVSFPDSVVSLLPVFFFKRTG